MVHKECKDLEGQQDNPESQVLMDQKALLAQSAPLDQMDKEVRQDLLGQKDLLVLLELQEKEDLREQGALKASQV